jgi:hypothetical protein
MSGTQPEPPATLPDPLRPGMPLVVIGINPSLYSVAVATTRPELRSPDC